MHRILKQSNQKTFPTGTNAQGDADLYGATFEILNSSNSVIQTLKATTNQITSNKLPLGTYKVREKIAPIGYNINPTVYTINITAPSQTVAVKTVAQTITDAVIKGDVVDSITTGNDGTATSKMLVYGDYTIKEVEPPIGFKISNDTQSVSIDDSKNEVYEVEFQNYPTEITIQKLASDINKPLEGAEVEVYNGSALEVTS